MRWSLRLKTTLLFVVVASVPAAATGYFLVNINADAVRTTERTLQASVIAELASVIEQQSKAARDQLASLAASLESGDDSDSAIASLKTLLQSATLLETVRVVVPTEGTNLALTVRQSGVSTPPDGLLRQCEADGVAEALHGYGTFLLCRRLQTPSPQPSYVVANLEIEPIDVGLERVITSRFPGGRSRVVVAGFDGQVLLGRGFGSPVESHPAWFQPVWSWLPPNPPRLAEYALVGTVHTDRGAELIGAHALGSPAVRILASRPEADAYAALADMRERTIHAALISMAAACLLGWAAARRLVRPIEAMVKQAANIGARQWTKVSSLARTRDELGDLAVALESMAHRLQTSEVEIQKEAHLRAELSRYMSQPLIDRIVAGRHSLRMGGSRAAVTVVFADVVRFTQLAEVEKPEAVVAWLNELFAILTEVVLRNGGVVDKFMGDSIMAFWGAPGDEPRHAHRALRAASEMTRFVEVANRDWSRRFGRSLELGVGVNTGECIVGNVGSSKRMEYTVVGDSVNIAARLEKHAAPGQILVGGPTRGQVAEDPEFEFMFVGQQKVAGRREMLDVYELVSD